MSLYCTRSHSRFSIRFAQRQRAHSHILFEADTIVHHERGQDGTYTPSCWKLS